MSSSLLLVPLSPRSNTVMNPPAVCSWNVDLEAEQAAYLKHFDIVAAATGLAVCVLVGVVWFFKPDVRGGVYGWYCAVLFHRKRKQLTISISGKFLKCS